MVWQGRVVTSPETPLGWPLIAGTRIGVDFLLDLLASGRSNECILAEYPHLEVEDLQVVFGFMRDCLKDEAFILEAKVAASLSE